MLARLWIFRTRWEPQKRASKDKSGGVAGTDNAGTEGDYTDADRDSGSREISPYAKMSYSTNIYLQACTFPCMGYLVEHPSTYIVCIPFWEGQAWQHVKLVTHFICLVHCFNYETLLLLVFLSFKCIHLMHLHGWVSRNVDMYRHLSEIKYNSTLNLHLSNLIHYQLWNPVLVWLPCI